jgi:hypothetical protein
MMQTFAYEIAAAFFLAAMLIGGSFLRGFFSQEILRAFKTAAIGLILAGCGVWIYHAIPSDPVATSVSNTVVGVAATPKKEVQKSRRLEQLRESDRRALAAAMAEEAAKPDVPTHIIVGGDDGAIAGNIPEKRGNRIVKSVGRALHIVPKTTP